MSHDNPNSPADGLKWDLKPILSFSQQTDGDANALPGLIDAAVSAKEQGVPADQERAVENIAEHLKGMFPPSTTTSNEVWLTRARRLVETVYRSGQESKVTAALKAALPRQIPEATVQRLLDEIRLGWRKSRDVVLAELKLEILGVGTDLERREWARRIAEFTEPRVEEEAKPLDASIARKIVEAIKRDCEKLNGLDVVELAPVISEEISSATDQRRTLTKIEQVLAADNVGTASDRRDWAKRIAELLEQTASKGIRHDLSEKLLRQNTNGPPLDPDLIRTLAAAIERETNDAIDQRRRLSKIERVLAKNDVGMAAERREWAKWIAEWLEQAACVSLDGDKRKEELRKHLNKACEKSPPGTVDILLKEAIETAAERTDRARIELQLASENIGTASDRREWAKRIVELQSDSVGELTPKQIDTIKRALTTLKDRGGEGLSEATALTIIEAIRQRRTANARKSAIERELAKLNFVSDRECREWVKLILDQNAAPSLSEKLQIHKAELRYRVTELSRSYQCSAKGSADADENYDKNHDAEAIEGQKRAVEAAGDYAVHKVLKRLQRPRSGAQKIEELPFNEEKWVKKDEPGNLPKDLPKPSDDPAPPVVKINVSDALKPISDISLEIEELEDAQIIYVPERGSSDRKEAIRAWCVGKDIPFATDTDEFSLTKALERNPELTDLLAWNRTLHRETSRLVNGLRQKIASTEVDKHLCERLLAEGPASSSAGSTPINNSPQLKQFRSHLESEIKGYSDKLLAQRQESTVIVIDRVRLSSEALEQVPGQHLFIEKDDQSQSGASAAEDPDVEKWKFRSITDKDLADKLKERLKNASPSGTTHKENWSEFWSTHILQNVALAEVRRLGGSLGLKQLDSLEVALTANRFDTTVLEKTPEKLLMEDCLKADSRTNSGDGQALSAGVRSIPIEASWENLNWKHLGLYRQLAFNALGMPAKVASGVFAVFALFMLLGLPNPVKTLVKGYGASSDASAHGQPALLCLFILLWLTIVGLAAGKLHWHAVKSYPRLRLASFPRSVVCALAILLTYICLVAGYRYISGSLNAWRSAALAEQKETTHDTIGEDDKRAFADELLTVVVPLTSKTSKRQSANAAVNDNTLAIASLDELKLLIEETSPLRFAILAGDTSEDVRAAATQIDNIDTQIANTVDLIDAGLSPHLTDFGLALRNALRRQDFAERTEVLNKLVASRASSEQPKEDEWRSRADLLIEDVEATKKVWKTLRETLPEYPTATVRAMQAEAFDALFIPETGSFSQQDKGQQAERIAAMSVRNGAHAVLASALKPSTDHAGKWRWFMFIAFIGLVGAICFRLFANSVEAESPATAAGIVALLCGWALGTLFIVSVAGWHASKVAVENDDVSARQFNLDAAGPKVSPAARQRLLRAGPELWQPASWVWRQLPWSKTWNWEEFLADGEPWTLGATTESWHMEKTEVDSRTPGTPLSTSPGAVVTAVLGLFVIAALFYWWVSLPAHVRERDRKLREANQQARADYVRRVEEGLLASERKWLDDFAVSVSIWIDRQCRRLEFELTHLVKQQQESRADDSRQLKQRLTSLAKTAEQLSKRMELAESLQDTCLTIRKAAAKELLRGN